MIQREEFLRAYHSLYPEQDRDDIDERANEIFERVDLDGNGWIDFREWCTVTMNQIEMLSEPNMRTAFNMFDRDGDGTIDANELEAILGESIKTKSTTAW